MIPALTKTCIELLDFYDLSATDQLSLLTKAFGDQETTDKKTRLLDSIWFK